MSLSKDIEAFVEANLKAISYNVDEISCLCPIHNNTDSPSFSINRHNGLWICYNPDCGARGSITQLAEKLGVKWLGASKAPVADISDDELMRALEETPEDKLDDWDSALEDITINYRKPEEVEKLRYLLDRGFTPAVLEHFEIAYSTQKNRIVIPTRDEAHKLVGFIGRAAGEEQPKYLYSRKFPKRNLIYNLNNAKTYTTGIVTEGSLDAIKIHQAGFPNVVSVLGANITPQQGELLDRNFTELVLFLDNDEPGESAKRAIIDMCPGKKMWVIPYPEGVKDPGEMSEVQIRTSLENKIDNLSYYFDKGEV